MKSLGFLPLLLSGASAVTIVSDACARAVGGTSPCRNHPGLSSRVADCSSFLAITEAPATTTSTVTVFQTPKVVTDVQTSVVVDTVTTTDGTVTVTVTHASTLSVVFGRRQVSSGAVTIRPSDIPGYAAVCVDAEHYSTACESLGVEPITIVAGTPAAVATVTGSASVLTETVVTTITSTLVDHETATATATVVPDIACGSTFVADGECGCEYIVNCNMYPLTVNSAVGFVPADSRRACALAYDNNPDCSMAEFYSSINQCALMGGTHGQMQSFDGEDAMIPTGVCVNSALCGPQHNPNPPNPSNP